jgi:hypothetical protein
MCPLQDPAEGFILNYTLLIGDASFSNFQKARESIVIPHIPEQAFMPYMPILVDHRLEGHAAPRTE